MKAIITLLAYGRIVSKINDKFNTDYKLIDVEDIRFAYRYINIWTRDGKRFDLEYEISFN